jgi:site-specific DNA-methyltransferase (adenine-specific)
MIFPKGTTYPNMNYRIIYADPPWTYNDKNNAGDRNLKYPTMTLDEIKALPVKSISNKDSFCFLWVTNPLLNEGLDVLKAWGFEYKTIAFTWIKETENGKEFIGMGNYTRANPEICLLGKRGKPHVFSHSVRQYVRARIKNHSQKPDVIRTKIVELCGDAARIELFARSKVFDWDVWGNDVKLDAKTLDPFT